MAREASQSPMLRVIATLTGLPPPATAGEYSRWTARGSPMYDVRAVALVAAGDLVIANLLMQSALRSAPGEQPVSRRCWSGLGLGLGG